MQGILRSVVAFVAMVVCSGVRAGETVQPSTSPSATPAASAIEVPLWSGEAPGSEGWPNQEETRKGGLILHTYRPAMFVHLPEAGKATGDAVIICPGGGYNVLEFEKEGTRIAERLCASGIASVVLKYRTRRFDQPDKTYVERALADAQRALRTVRANARQWHIDAKRIGIGGFSAGAHLAMNLAAHCDSGDAAATDPIEQQSCRPDFVFSVYGGMRDYAWINDRTPAFFLAHASDDAMVPVRGSIELYQSLISKNVNAELHIFPTGGHGFGVGVAGTGTAQWLDLLKTWIVTRSYEHATTRPVANAEK